ncbi:MAG: hypothetical protein LLG01_15925 [Planctomycetaceae bacterium]|nr:hypothetical protein [Planctomycetaceae bacterium]
MTNKKESLYKLLDNPPASVQADLQAPWNALVTAFKALSKSKRKKLQQDIDEEFVARIPPKWRDRIAAALTAKREREYAQ